MSLFAGHRPPPGWSISTGRLQEDSTVGGYHQRGCAVSGRCYRNDCRRTCWLDFRELIRSGMERLPVAVIQHTLKCHRLDGCSLEFHEKPERVLTLRDIAGRPHIALEAFCLGCRKTHLTTVEAMISRLKSAQTGDETTPLSKLDSLAKGPCPACGYKRWRIEVLWYDPAGKPPLWRRELDERLDAKRTARDLREVGAPR